VEDASSDAILQHPALPRTTAYGGLPGPGQTNKPTQLGGCRNQKKKKTSGYREIQDNTHEEPADWIMLFWMLLVVSQVL